MKNIFKVAVLSLIVVTLFVGCGNNTKSSEKKETKVLTGTELLSAQKEGALVIDVRKSESFNKGHIKNAINVPLSDIKEKISSVENDKAKKIVLYCNTGNKSGKALKILKEKGYTNVFNAEGVKQFKYDLETN